MTDTSSSEPAALNPSKVLPWQQVARWLAVCTVLVLVLHSLGMALQLPQHRGIGYPLTTQLFQLTWAVDWSGPVLHWISLERGVILA